VTGACEGAGSLLYQLGFDGLQGKYALAFLSVASANMIKGFYSINN
jgi:hypothetical protein